MTTAIQSPVSDLYDRLAAIDTDAIPVVCTDRHIPRKQQAALARGLFKQFGLRGISVTTPNYSMAQTVQIAVPRIDDDLHDRSKWPHFHDYSDPSRSEATRCPACRERSAAVAKVEKILAIAFPKHDDRSDSQSDYFDYCWSMR